ncbi:lipoate-protein ligase A [Dorcoceras hygrometricum]|uniref:Lipoate-protein ligase A n=1 Tax=Dorcoceras hygrometricum TaxID=472368 RepID=A0A2Z7C7A2_9LAMI|nr:lipoate-protein ligase A [Dorcoceras hygrometricum]
MTLDPSTNIHFVSQFEYPQNLQIEQQIASSNAFRESGPAEKEALIRKNSIDDALEDKICDIYELYVEISEENSGPHVKVLYEEKYIDKFRENLMFCKFPMAVSRTRNIGLPLISLLRLNGMPILEQLHLEERLLRTTSENWCLINNGTTDPTIVMGVSGKPVELLDTESVLRDEISVIRRYTGGGTVIVDHATIFVTFICNKDAISGLQSYPQPIMCWSSLLYKEVFKGIGDFTLRENDYVLGNRKFGGNAQSITKNRWVHHTSFLWDYEISRMGYLKLPKRAPQYRQARDHLEFICRMKDYIARSDFIDRTISAVGSHFQLRYSEQEFFDRGANVKLSL